MLPLLAPARSVLVALVLASLFSPPACASGRAGSVELGLDGRAALLIWDENIYFPYGYQGYSVDRDNTFVIDLPVSSVRAGFYATDVLELEPNIDFSFSSQGGHSSHSVQFGLDGLYNFTGAGSDPAPFVSLGGGLHSMGGASVARTQWHVNGGLGFRVPVGDRSALRFQIIAARNFENRYYLGYWDVGLGFGYSFFTR